MSACEGCGSSAASTVQNQHHLGSACSVAELRRLLESRLGLAPDSAELRLERLERTAREGGASRDGCPVAKWIIRRRQAEPERYLALVRHRQRHTCNSAVVAVAMVCWDGVPINLADYLFGYFRTELPRSGVPSERRCATNDSRTCACQGFDPDTCGAIYSFGCAWSLFHNACKFARTRGVARKFRLRNVEQEADMARSLNCLADAAGRVLAIAAPVAYANQTRYSTAAADCRLGTSETPPGSRPFSGATVGLDFCAHSHKEPALMDGGCSVVVALCRNRTSSDEQLHVFPNYALSDADEFGSAEGQRRKFQSGELQALNSFPRIARLRSAPSESTGLFAMATSRKRALRMQPPAPPPQPPMAQPLRHQISQPQSLLTSPPLPLPPTQPLPAAVRHQMPTYPHPPPPTSAAVQQQPRSHQHLPSPAAPVHQQPTYPHLPPQTQAPVQQHPLAPQLLQTQAQQQPNAHSTVTLEDGSPGSIDSGIESVKSNNQSPFKEELLGDTSVKPLPPISSWFRKSPPRWEPPPPQPQHFKQQVQLQRQLLLQRQQQQKLQNLQRQQQLQQAEDKTQSQRQQQQQAELSRLQQPQQIHQQQQKHEQHAPTNAHVASDSLSVSTAGTPTDSPRASTIPQLRDYPGWWQSHRQFYQRYPTYYGTQPNQYPWQHSSYYQQQYNPYPYPYPSYRYYPNSYDRYPYYASGQNQQQQSRCSCCQHSAYQHQRQPQAPCQQPQPQPQPRSRQPGPGDCEFPTDTLEAFRDSASGGVAIALTHGAVLIEAGKREPRATTAVRRPNRWDPASIRVALFQHKNLRYERHGFAEYAEKMRLLRQRRQGRQAAPEDETAAVAAAVEEESADDADTN